MRADVAIVGAGIGGLATASILANRGMKVAVLEKNFDIGGRITCSYYKGATIDHGPHVYWGTDQPGGIARILSEVGEPIEWIDLDPLKIYMGGKSAQFGTSFFSMSLAVAMGQATRIARKAKVLSVSDVKEIIPIVVEIASLSREEISQLDIMSLGEWLRQRTSNEKLAEIFRCIATVPLTIDDLDLISAGEFMRAALMFLRVRKPVSYPKDGGQAIPEAFARAIENRGSKIVTECSVDEIEVKRSEVVGVKARIEKKEIRVKAPVVVFNGPVYGVFNLASRDAFSRSFVKRMEDLKGKVTSGISIIAGLKRPIFSYSGPILHHNEEHIRYLLSPSNAYELAGTKCNPYLFYGHYVEPEVLQSREKIREACTTLLSDLKERHRNFEKEAAWIATGAIRTIDGLARKPGLTGNFRPATSCPDVKGLFFVGDMIRGNGNGTSAAVDSALSCSSAILDNREKLFAS